MRLFGSLVFQSGMVMIIVAMVSSLRSALAGRRKSETILLLVLLVVPLILRSETVILFGALSSAAFALVPYALLRLARHFRDIPSHMLVIALIVAAASVVVGLAGYPHRAVGLTVFRLMSFAAMCFVATVFARQVRR